MFESQGIFICYHTQSHLLTLTWHIGWSVIEDNIQNLTWLKWIIIPSINWQVSIVPKAISLASSAFYTEVLGNIVYPCCALGLAVFWLWPWQMSECFSLTIVKANLSFSFILCIPLVCQSEIIVAHTNILYLYRIYILLELLLTKFNSVWHGYFYL